MIPTLTANPSFLSREVKPLTPLTPSYPRKPSIAVTNTPLSSTPVKIEPLVSDRPTLLSPSNFRLTKFVCELERTLQSMIETLSDRLSTISNESAEQSRAYQKELKENEEKIKSGLVWSALKKIWSAFFSAITILFGASNVIAGNLFVGAALISSGILSITNLLCSEMGVWDEVAKKLAQEDEARKKQILFSISITLSILSAGLALFGGVYDLTQSKEFLSNQFLFALLASCSILSGIVDIGQGVTQMRTLDAQAGLLKIQTLLEITNIQSKMCSEVLSNFFASTQQIFERISRIMQMNAQTNLTILQG